MVVELLDMDPENSSAVLKLYDRRFAKQLRDDYKLGPLTVAKDKAFWDFVKSGGAASFLDRLGHDDDFEEPDEYWDSLQYEIVIHNACHNSYKTEVGVYRKLKDLQGKEIPILRADVRVQACIPENEVEIMKMDPSISSANFFEVQGLLLEHIEGYTLSAMVDRALRHH